MTYDVFVIILQYLYNLTLIWQTMMFSVNGIQWISLDNKLEKTMNY